MEQGELLEGQSVRPTVELPGVLPQVPLTLVKLCRFVDLRLGQLCSFFYPRVRMVPVTLQVLDKCRCWLCNRLRSVISRKLVKLMSTITQKRNKLTKRTENDNQ